mgnify:FL=1|jgi:hypothetical protein|tara:strand:- start:730 stop:1137 length:408 start_codon:yes stop_codon:yes gene_type:complete
MGQNSTEVAYGFGQFGSTYLTGDGAILDLDGASAKYYVCAITFTEDTTFQNLNILDAGVGLGMGNTHFVSTEDTQTLDSDWGAVTDAGDDDGKVVTTSHTFPKGVTLYGMYDFVELNGGACICYVAPRPDYRTRA